MSRMRYLALGVVVMNVAGGAAFAAEPKVVIQDLVAQGVELHDAAAISTATCNAFAQRKAYKVVCGDDLRALMQWNALAVSLNACQGDGCINDASKAIQARYVVSGNVSKIDTEYVLSLSMIDVVSTAVGRTEVKADSMKRLFAQVSEAIDQLLPKK